MHHPRIALALAAVLSSTASCSSGPRSHPDIVLITVDTLRADRIGLYGYPRDTTPNIDRWFVDGAIFTRAYATSANTSPSIVSILSGQLPQEHRVRLFYQLLPNETALIPDLLPDVYQTAAFVSNIVLTDEAMGMARRFDHYDDWVDEKEGRRNVFERNALRTTDAALRWLQSERDPERPLFLWVHYIDPHGPYDPPDHWSSSFTHDEPVPIRAPMPKYIREPAVSDARVYVDRYDEEIAYADAQIGRLLGGYAQSSAIDDALLVFTADHGESMMEHERWFSHGYHVYEEIVRVPLLIRGPGFPAGRREGVVSGIDVSPTVLGFAGADVPDSLRGLDLREPPRQDVHRTVFAETTGSGVQWRAAILGDRKWVVRLRGPKRDVEERFYYDLAVDPKELRPTGWGSAARPSKRLLELSRTDPDPAGQPRHYRKGIRLKAPKVAPRATDEQIERLEALGYVE